MSCLAHLAGGPIVIACFWQGYPFFHEEIVRLILQVIPDGSFVFPKSDLHLKTMSMLSRSMSMVLRFSTRTFEAQYQMFLAQLSKHRCMGNVMKFLSPYLKSFLHYILSWISCSACPWEGYTLEICV